MTGVGTNVGGEGSDVDVKINHAGVDVEVGGEKGDIDTRLDSLKKRIGSFKRAVGESSSDLNQLRNKLEAAEKSQDPNAKENVVKEGEDLLRSQRFEDDIESIVDDPLFMEKLDTSENLIKHFQTHPIDKSKPENLRPDMFVRDTALLAEINTDPKVWEMIVQNASDGHDIFELLANRKFSLKDSTTWTDSAGHHLGKAGATISSMVKNNSKLLIGAAIGIPAILLLKKFGKYGKIAAGTIAGVLGFSVLKKFIGPKATEWIFEKLGIQDYIDQAKEIKKSIFGDNSPESKPPKKFDPPDEPDSDVEPEKDVKDGYKESLDYLKKECHWAHMKYVVNNNDEVTISRTEDITSIKLTRKDGEWIVGNGYARVSELKSAAALANLINWTRNNIDSSKAESSKPFEVDGDDIDFKLKTSISAPIRHGFGIFDQDFIKESPKHWLSFYESQLGLSKITIVECLNNWFRKEMSGGAPTPEKKAAVHVEVTKE